MPSLCARIRTNTHSTYSSLLYLPYLPHIPSLIHLTGKKTGDAEEKQGYNGNTGTGAMMQETGCTILQKPLRKPPVPAHPPIRETCAFY